MIIGIWPRFPFVRQTVSGGHWTPAKSLPPPTSNPPSPVRTAVAPPPQLQPTPPPRGNAQDCSGISGLLASLLARPEAPSLLPSSTAGDPSCSKSGLFTFCCTRLKKRKQEAGKSRQGRSSAEELAECALDCFVVPVFESFHHISSRQKVRIGACAKKKKVFS